jgi:hypothetical protein
MLQAAPNAPPVLVVDSGTRCVWEDSPRVHHTAQILRNGPTRGLAESMAPVPTMGALLAEASRC